MKVLILSLSWIILIAADQESISNYKSKFDGREAPTLKPIDYSDAVFQEDFAKNPNSKIFYRYKQQMGDRVPQVQVEKENIRHYFRVRKPIARRKIFHIQKESLESIPLAESHQVINVSTVITEPTPQEVIVKNNVELDKRIDDVLDKLPELIEVTQETIIVPLSQETIDKNNNVETTTSNETEDVIAASNVIVTPQEYFIGTDTRPNSQYDDKSSEPDYKENTDKSETLLNSNPEDLIHIEEPNDSIIQTTFNYLETTAEVLKPELEIFLLSDGGNKWKWNDTVDSVPKILVEEFIIEPYPSLSPSVESKFIETSVTSKNVVNGNGDKNESDHQSVIKPLSETVINTESTDINSSSVVTETSDPSSKMRLIGIRGHLLSNLSNAEEDPTQSVAFTGNVGNKSLKSPRRRTRRRKLRKNKIASHVNPDIIEDFSTNATAPVEIKLITSTTTQIPVTDVITTPITTLSERFKHHFQTTTPRSRFTHYQDKFRGRNGIHKVSRPIAETEKRLSLASSIKVHSHTTTTTSPYTQYRAQSKFRKWNRSRNITPTVINPREDVPKTLLLTESSTNITDNLQNITETLKENPVSANKSDTITENPMKVTTSEPLERSTFPPTAISNPPTYSPRRMRFRNKLRHIKTSTQSTPSANVSTTGTSVEITSATLENKGSNTTLNQSTGKLTQPPPPPPTLSPWYDGFGK